MSLKNHTSQCSICKHPQRGAIDRAILDGGSCRNVAKRYGLSHVAVFRHGWHFARYLDRRAKKKLGEVLRHARWHTNELLDIAKSVRSVPSQFLKVSPELDRSLNTLGKVNGEIAGDRVQNLFVNLGVRSEAELKRAVDLARRGRDVSPEAFRDELFQGLRFLLAEHPEWRQDALAVIEQSSHAEVVNGGTTNGTPRQALRSGDDPA